MKISIFVEIFFHNLKESIGVGQCSMNISSEIFPKGVIG